MKRKLRRKKECGWQTDRVNKTYVRKKKIRQNKTKKKTYFHK